MFEIRWMRRVHPAAVARGACLLLLLALILASQPVTAATIFGLQNPANPLGGGFRWDAAPRIVSDNERSLDGGLRYSMQGGSLQAYRDLFSWTAVPSVPDFGTAVGQAFGAWTSVDPMTGLPSALSFVDDTMNTSVAGTPGFGGINIDGAEIDLFGADAGNGGTRGVASFNAFSGPVTLTSGTTNYGALDGGGVIAGADVYINSNVSAVYSLDVFRRLLTHELGHALGFGDVEDFFNLGFIDDDYDPADPVGTLTNPWAHKVNIVNPAASGALTLYPPGAIANGTPGLKSFGVNILMESEGLGISPGNPVTNLVPLTADDYGARQFLYPVAIPEPSTFALVAWGVAVLAAKKRRR